MFRKTLPLVLLVLFFSANAFADYDFYHINPVYSYFSMNKWAHVDAYQEKSFDKFLCKFKDIRGLISLLGDSKKDWMIVASVVVESLVSGNDALDDALKGPGFFDVEKYPEIQINIFPVPQKFYKVDRKEAVAVITIKGITKKFNIGNFMFVTCSHGREPYTAVINCGDVFESLKINLKDFDIDINELKTKGIDPKKIGLTNEVFIGFRFETLENLNTGFLY